jgi:hypothetical protein
MPVRSPPTRHRTPPDRVWPRPIVSILHFHFGYSVWFFGPFFFFPGFWFDFPFSAGFLVVFFILFICYLKNIFDLKIV